MAQPGTYLPDEECLASADLQALQCQRLRRLLDEVIGHNPLYSNKLEKPLPDGSLYELLDALPFTTRAELEADQVAHPPFGTNLTYSLDRYCRFHQTSGTHGRPMRWLDTPESWAWFGQCWATIFGAAGVGRGDRLFFPFSFGPFVGFWAAFESAAALGWLCIPAGGLSTPARLRMMIENKVTVVCCTPTYALRMAEVAREEGIDLAGSAVRTLIVAGEPGGSIPSTRHQIESAWGARLFDHTGMTEIGAMSFGCSAHTDSVHVIENQFIAEVIDPSTGQRLPEEEAGELVLTNLGRWGSPLIRYRTNDQVRLVRGDGPCGCGRTFARLDGGILGRVDDMFIVRGNNVFPTAVEAVLRSFPEVQEYRVRVSDNGPLTEVEVDVEPIIGVVDGEGLIDRVGKAVQAALSFRAEVHAVPPGTLPRFEMKSHRFVRVR